MEQTDEWATFHQQPQERSGWTAAIAGSLAVFVVALSVVIALRAGWLDGVSDGVVGMEPRLLSAIVAAGILLGGISLLWMVLSRFVREVESAPYVWLAPIVTALPSIAIVAWELPAPHGIPGRLFALVWVPLLIGGGSLLQLKGLGRQLLGILCFLAPMLFVLGSMAAEHGWNPALAWQNASQPERLFAAVVSLTCIGIGLLAGLTQASQERAEHIRDERQLIAHERASLANERAELDQLVSRAESVLGDGDGGLGDSGFSTGPVPGDRRGRLWMLAAVPVVLVAGLATYEFVHRRPMRAMEVELAAAQAEPSQTAAAGGEKIAALQAERDKLAVDRDKAVSERNSLAEELASLKAGTATGGGQGEGPAGASKAAGATGEDATAQKPASKAEPKTKAKTKRSATLQAAKRQRLAAAKRKRAARAKASKSAAQNAAKASKKGPSLGGTSSSSDDPLAGIEF